MKLGGALKFLRLFLFTQTASDIAERRVRRKRLSVDSFRWFFRGGRGLLVFLGFDLRAIFRGKNLSALQIFFCVDVLVFFLLAFLARAFLLGSVSDILTVGLGSAKNSARCEKNRGKEERHRTVRTTHGGREVHRCWG